jgi:3-oxoacyl-[acyl-carrier protein] reductase
MVMPNSASDKTVVITGGARGLGRAIASALFYNGHRVAINYLNSRGPAEELAAMFGDRVLLLKADAGDSGEVHKMAAHVQQQWGNVDALVNNAAITADALCIRQTEADWDEVMRTNLKGPFNAITAFAPLMQRGGHIINIGSYSGIRGKAGQSAYSASKAALLGLSRTAAIDLAEKDIRVNAVVPGYMATEMGLQAAEALDHAASGSLLHTLCDPAEVAAFIAFLIETKTITGQVFCLDSRII